MSFESPGDDVYTAFHLGDECHAHRILGAHEIPGKPSAWHFGVFAPHAYGVELHLSACEPEGYFPMQKGEKGIYEVCVPSVRCDGGAVYSYVITTSDGRRKEVPDPYGMGMTLEKPYRSILRSASKYQWHDQAWMDRVVASASADTMNIYELHLPTWFMIHTDLDYLNCVLDNAEGREKLVSWVREMGYTHVECMPIMVHKNLENHGYLLDGYFSVSSNYGHDDSVKALIDEFHQAGISVILDWVPAYFTADEGLLSRFDGEALYEPADSRRAFMRSWNAMLFDLNSPAVQSFLLSSAFYWLEEFHADGLRINGVSAMVYHDVCREEGEWLANSFGGRENLEGISFLKRLNEIIHQRIPGRLMIAEEAQAFPGVTRPISENGLGFDYKWNTGWVTDLLAYLNTPEPERKWHHDKLTFSLYYAFSEKFVLPLSHETKSCAAMQQFLSSPESAEKKQATVRATYAYAMAHPGKKLLYIGSEFFRDRKEFMAQINELAVLVKDLNGLYLSEGPLHEIDDNWSGFQWSQANDSDNSVISFLRWDRNGHAVLCITNFSSVSQPVYRMGLPVAGTLTPLFSSEETKYGGKGNTNCDTVTTENVPWNNMQYSVVLSIPALATVYYRFHRVTRSF